MDPEYRPERLSRLPTLWTLVRQAHGPEDAAGAARRQLLERYAGAAYQYLLGAARDEDTARDLFQEFVVRFLRGDFHRADPDRGRFRDYLKTALRHLLADHHRARAVAPVPLVGDHPAAVEEERSWLDAWREELIARAWQALQDRYPTYRAVLVFHIERPDVSSAEAAQHLSLALGKTMTPTAARVTLHRAREKLAQLLLEEVRASLGDPTEDELRAELRQLGLEGLCQP